MNESAEIRRRLAILERKVDSMIRVGVVSSVNRETCRARVTFPGGLVSGDLPILVKQAVGNRDFWMPEIDEQVTCVFLPNGTEIGFILGSFYSDEDERPTGTADPGVRMVEFSDGARFEFNTETSTFRLLVGDLELTITPDLMRIGGSGATQSFVRGEDLVALIQAHTHPTGVGPSGPPANASSFPDALSDIIKGR